MKNLSNEIIIEEIKNYFINNKEELDKKFSYQSKCILTIDEESLPLTRFLDISKEKYLYIMADKELFIGYKIFENIYGLKYKIKNWFLTYETY